ncbi:hypothetical protein, partial [Rhizobium leguminosarum]|uniref:hypothetical protein n=1 Tax=Rhizobium leguminosarum TaxID=384 RepID=UPI003F9A36BF
MNKSLILILSAIFVLSACNLTPAEKIAPATIAKNDTVVVKIEPVKDSAISEVRPSLDTTLVNEATGAIMDLPEIKRL